MTDYDMIPPTPVLPRFHLRNNSSPEFPRTDFKPILLSDSYELFLYPHTQGPLYITLTSIPVISINCIKVLLDLQLVVFVLIYLTPYKCVIL